MQTACIAFTQMSIFVFTPHGISQAEIWRQRALSMQISASLVHRSGHMTSQTVNFTILGDRL